MKIRINRKININNPLSGSFANVCTEFKIPERTRKVPHILRVNVAIDRIIARTKDRFFSNIIMECNKVVKARALKKHFQQDPKTKIHPNQVHNTPK